MGRCQQCRRHSHDPIWQLRTPQITDAAYSSYLQGVSNSGRLLAYGYGATPSFTLPKENLLPTLNPGNDLYVSNLSGGWNKVKHDAGLDSLFGADVNNAGQAVGYAVDSSGRSQAFYTTGDGGTLKLVAANASESVLGSINDQGIAVGVMQSGADETLHVFTLDTNTGLLQDLGLDPGGGLALKINDAGQVIRGGSLYDPGRAQWLQPSVDGLAATWTFADINNHGDILAKSSSGIYILQAIPEPTTLLMTGLGLAGIGLATHRQRRTRLVVGNC